MVLKFPGAWRFNPPIGDSQNTRKIPSGAVGDAIAWIQKVATQGDLQEYLELFKGHFCSANGTTHIWSSNSSWAESDLRSEMEAAAENPPLFLEALYDACESVRARPGELFAPDATMINALCRKHGIGYELNPPVLTLRDSTNSVVSVPERPPTLAEKAREILTASLRRAEDLLETGQGREAVQESLWLLETVTTAFRGMETATGSIEGKYFNKIVRELRQAAHGTTLDRVLEWTESLHGYLSSPTGGGVRHGLDLRDGLELAPNESKLFCNLIRSYLAFLLSEHERLTHRL